MAKLVDLPLDQLPSLISNRLGLILGPGAVFQHETIKRLSEQIADHYQVSIGRNYIETSDEALELPSNDEAGIRDLVRRFFGDAKTKATDLKALAEIKWKPPPRR